MPCSTLARSWNECRSRCNQGWYPRADERACGAVSAPWDHESTSASHRPLRRSDPSYSSCVLSHARWIRPDSVGVYSWPLSATFDGDLLFFNERGRFGMIGEGFPFFKEVTERGTVANHWWIGTSINCRAFLHCCEILSSAFESLFPRDGFFGVYSAFLAWTTVLFGALSFILGLRLLEIETDIVAGGRTTIHLAILSVLRCSGTSFGTPGYASRRKRLCRCSDFPPGKRRTSAHHARLPDPFLYGHHRSCDCEAKSCCPAEVPYRFATGTEIRAADRPENASR